MQNFQKLISPISISSFIETYWEKTFLYIHRGDESYYTDVITVQEIDEYLQNKEIRYPALRLVKNGLEALPEQYTTTLAAKNRVFNKIIDNHKMFEIFKEGATITLTDIHRSINKISTFSLLIERELGFPIQVNMYITPPNAQGFSPHFDLHDVIVLQICGTKNWHIYNTPISFPTKNQTNTNYKVEEPSSEISVSPGDFLYIPRGLVHDAKSTNDVSAHITIGLLTYKNIDILTELARIVEKDEYFREALPINFHSEKQKELVLGKLFEKLQSVFSPDNFSTALDNISKHFKSNSLKDDSNKFWEMVNISRVSVDSEFKLRDTTNINVETLNDKIKISFLQKNIYLPISAESIITKICKGNVLKMSIISSELDDKSKVMLLRKFLEIGFVKLLKL